MRKESSSFQRRRAYQLFNEAVTQESIERMADDVYMYQRPSPEFERLEKLAEIFMQTDHIGTVELYSTMRKEYLKFRDPEGFLLFAQDQYEFKSTNKEKYGDTLDKIIYSDSPAMRLVK